MHRGQAPRFLYAPFSRLSMEHGGPRLQNPRKSGTFWESTMQSSRSYWRRHVPRLECRRLAAHMLLWRLLSPLLFWANSFCLAGCEPSLCPQAMGDPVSVDYLRACGPDVFFSSRLLGTLCSCPILGVAKPRSWSGRLFSSRSYSLPWQCVKFAGYLSEY